LQQVASLDQRSQIDTLAARFRDDVVSGTRSSSARSCSVRGRARKLVPITGIDHVQLAMPPGMGKPPAKF
jgi:hypothetical protein